MEQFFNCVIVGGGVAGFTAAIALAEQGIKNIAVLEGGDRVCRKLSASGNGQGNIANEHLRLERYHGSFKPVAEKVFARFNLEQILSFYKRCGIYTVSRQSGRIYPISMQASSVTDCIRLRARQLSIMERVGFKAAGIKLDGGIKSSGSIKLGGIKSGGGVLRIFTESGEKINAGSIILACGGAASSNMSCGTGYGLMEKYGHKCTPLSPSLVRLTTKERFPVLSGIRMDAHASLLCGGELAASVRGDVQFNQYGISGSAAFELSGSAVRSVNGKKHTQIVLDFLPDISISRLAAMLTECGSAAPLTLGQSMVSIIPKQLISIICDKSGFDPGSPCAAVSSKDYDNIASNIKNFYVTVTGSLGLDNAQVTAGGLCAADFTDGLMSKLMPGVYACGEMLDLDGDCGGFNIMWAVASALAAADACAKLLQGV